MSIYSTLCKFRKQYTTINMVAAQSVLTLYNDIPHITHHDSRHFDRIFVGREASLNQFQDRSSYSRKDVSFSVSAVDEQ